MENNNGTVTISLEVYQDMMELIKEQNKRIDQLADAHSVVIDRRKPTGKIVRLGNTKEYTWHDQTTFQIKGSLTETNEAFQALRNELDELHARGNDREAKWVATIEQLQKDLIQRDMALNHLNKGKFEQWVDKLNTNKPKKWYQF
jgi:hypothetical protein